MMLRFMILLWLLWSGYLLFPIYFSAYLLIKGLTWLDDRKLEINFIWCLPLALAYSYLSIEFTLLYFNIVIK